LGGGVSIILSHETNDTPTRVIEMNRAKEWNRDFFMIRSLN